MALPIFQRNVVDAQGNILPGAQVTVRDEATGDLVTLFSDREGNTALSNPFFADAQGLAVFYSNPGEYRIDAIGAGGTVTWRYVQVIDTQDITTIGDNFADIETVADNIADVNTAAGNIQAIIDAPAEAQAAANSAAAASTSETNAANSASAAATSAALAEDFSQEAAGYAQQTDSEEYQVNFEADFGLITETSGIFSTENIAKLTMSKSYTKLDYGVI